MTTAQRCRSPYPYAQHWLLDLPLPFLTNRRLDALLAARPGERVLEVRPGTGLQAAQVADLLGGRRTARYRGCPAVDA
jgi:hypothetical protein